ncbi:cutinase [Arthroderma uncinatum]|uniref:cutinase n=1 Tax=Arthroderma uncinatum TaxID=74035 RepID=UPI00144AD747|nr:cutinase [Arthroderma uncinatum]KAF3483856.1 cutinase [Arthroderma uncinatum]
MKIELALLLANIAAYAIAAPNRAIGTTSTVTIRSVPTLPERRERQWWEYEGEDVTTQSVTSSLFQAIDNLNKVARYQQEKDFGVESTDDEGTVENGILEHAPCQPLTMIFARGTNEAGNMGRIIGRPLAAALRKQTGNKIIIQGVNYDATPEGNLLLGLNGGPKMAELLEQSLAQCPDSKVVLVGYSQGAMVTHSGALLSEHGISAIAAFGDPGRFVPFLHVSADKVKKYCLPGDPVCLNGFDLDAHFRYGVFADDAAQFLIQASGAK